MKRKKVAIEVAAPVVPEVRRDSDGFAIIDQPEPIHLVDVESVLLTAKQVAAAIIANEPTDWKVVRFDERSTNGRYFGAMVKGYQSWYGGEGARLEVVFGFIQTRYITKSQRDKYEGKEGGEGSRFYQFHDEVRLQVLARPSAISSDRLVWSHEGVQTYAGGSARDSMEGVHYFVRSAIAAGRVAELLPAKNATIEL